MDPGRLYVEGVDTEETLTPALSLAASAYLTGAVSLWGTLPYVPLPQNTMEASFKDRTIAVTVSNS